MSGLIRSALLTAKGVKLNHAPSEAQKAAGNYKKHHVRMHGLDIALENVKGGKRSGVGRDGRRWTVTMPAHYGYIKRTEGADGDHVDVYIGPDHASKNVYVIDQKDAETGKFDEHKVMLGFGSEAQARATYLKGFSDGKGAQRIQSIKPMTIDRFKEWLKGDTTKPAGRVAKADGGALRLYHGTEHSEPINQLDPFISPDQLGVHLGDAATANRFAKRMTYDPKTNATRAPRVIPFDVRMKNPLRLHDNWGTWEPSIVHKQLMDRGLVPVDHDFNDALMAMENGEHPGGKPAKNEREERQLQRAAMDEIHNIIRGLGHDGIVYLNRYEMPTDEAKERLDKGPLMRGQLNKMTDEEFKQHFPESVDSYISFDLSQLKSPFGEGSGAGFADGGEVDSNLDQFYGPTDGSLRRRYYTGTSKDKDFTAFQESRHGTWLTDDPESASQYALHNDSQDLKLVPGTWNYEKVNTASRVIPAYVRIENPYTGGKPEWVLKQNNYKKAQSDWFDILRHQGYDAWVPESENGSLVVKLKNQGTHIKSAIGNSGAYDLTKKHLAKAEGGTVDEQEDEASAARLGDGSQAGGLPLSGGVRGGEGVLPASLPAHGEVDLPGLPTNIKIPKLGMTVVAGHNPLIRKVAREYARTAGIDYNPPAFYKKVDPDLGTRIAHAYENMEHNPSHPLVKASYEALKRETLAQYQAAKAAGLKMEFYPDPTKDPYQSQPRLMSEDVNKNHHMYVYPTDAGFGTGQQPEGHENNPLLGDSGERWNGKPVTFNDLFRAVHDYYGHVKEGFGFRGDGEENAWRSHAAMYSPLARIALGSETRGQNSLLNYGPNGERNRNASTDDTFFSPQKLGVLPIWAHHEGAEFIRPEERAQMEEIYKNFGVEPEGVVGASIRNAMSVFPKPQRMFPEDARPPGGQYLAMPDKRDVTGHKAAAATIGVQPGGKPFFKASADAVDQTGSTGRGTATAKTNLFKQKAGWKWDDAPAGHENTDTIVSVEHRGRHHYALNAHFPRGVDLTRYENSPTEPRLRPTTTGNVELGPQVGSILVRGKQHPVYRHVIVKSEGGSIGHPLEKMDKIIRKAMLTAKNSGSRS